MHGMVHPDDALARVVMTRLERVAMTPLEK